MNVLSPGPPEPDTRGIQEALGDSDVWHDKVTHTRVLCIILPEYIERVHFNYANTEPDTRPIGGCQSYSQASRRRARSP